MSLSRTLAKLIPQVTYSFKAFPAHEQSLETLEQQLHAAGNTVERVDHEGGYILCRQFTENSDVWGCMVCLEAEQVVFTDSENELRAHLDVAHEGYQIDERGIPVVL